MHRKDPIVEEVHRVRESIAREAGYDLDRIVDEARVRQSASGRKVVSLPAKRMASARQASGSRWQLAAQKAN